jgi:2-succinyl-6-hydroxy-2,4-cyclohexadiene-1-carboxylate synthase
MQVVALHGFTGSKESFARVLPALPAGTPVLRPALLGHYGSKRPPELNTFEAEVDYLAEHFLRPCRAPVLLVGYSLGGRVALGLAAHYPELVARVLVIGAHPGLESAVARAERRQDDERWCALLEAEGIRAFVSAWEQQPLFENQLGLPRDLVARRHAERLAHDPRGLARALRALGLGAMPPLTAALARAERPLHLVTGELDTKFTSLAAELAQRLPCARTTVVRGAGHDVLLEQPEVLANLITQELSP